MNIETPRLQLRPPRPGDEARLFPITSDPEVTRFLKRPGHRDLLETTMYLLEAVKLVSTGRGYCWVIEDQSGEVVGSMSVAYEQGPHAVIFGGYLGRKSWRRGYGLEAGQAVLRWLQDKPHIYRVSAQTDVSNEPINQLVRKLGMTLEGKLRRVWPPQGGGEPRDVFSWAWTR